MQTSGRLSWEKGSSSPLRKVETGRLREGATKGVIKASQRGPSPLLDGSGDGGPCPLQSWLRLNFKSSKLLFVHLTFPNSPANLCQWASPSASFISSLFSFLENARESGEEISFLMETALGFLPALGGGRGKNSQESWK